jgi:glycosyltransferase involved in cell wall biosynthesis
MNSQTCSERPLVSVVLATYNEGRLVDRCLASLQRQETPDFELEILVVDGKSTDGTKEIADQIAAADPRVRVFVNERRRTPFALNIGLRAARGKYVCIFGAHTVYTKNYIAVCLREMIAHGAVGCVGRIVTQPSNQSLEARLNAWTLGHPFGSSRKSFRTQPEGETESINFPIMLKAPLLEVGGFDEDLFRNQDLDMNQRLRAKGYKFYCTWKTECYYFPKGLLNYAFLNGFWNLISLKKNFGSFRVRHFVPCLFLLTLLFFLAFGLGGVFLPTPYSKLLSIPFAAVLGLHLSLGLIAGIQVAIRDKSPGALWLPFVFLAFHLCYGLGTLLALVTNAKPDSLPQVLVAARG